MANDGSQLNLTVLALVALVAIIALVALVLNVVAPVSTGVGQVSAADDANLAGQARNKAYYDDGGGGGGSNTCTCHDAGGTCAGCSTAQEANACLQACGAARTRR